MENAKKEKKTALGTVFLSKLQCNKDTALTPCLVEALFSYKLLFTWWKWPVYNTRLQFQTCFRTFQELSPLSWSLTPTFWKGPHYSTQWAGSNPGGPQRTWSQNPVGGDQEQWSVEGSVPAHQVGQGPVLPAAFWAEVWHISAPRPCTP